MPNLIQSKYTTVEIIPHKANVPESPIKIFAGLILYRKNAVKVAITITIIVVAKNHFWKKVITAKAHNIIIEVHPTSQSSQSVIFTALTIATVNIKVNI